MERVQLAAKQNGQSKIASLKAAWFLVPMALMLMAGAFMVIPGLYNIDEMLLLLGARAFLEKGDLVIANGLAEFSSPDLSLWHLVMGPDGLVPQYPVGPAIIGAPLLAIFDARGLMLLNVLAGIGTLIALWTLSSRHFGGKGVALVSVFLLSCATFWLEYVFAIWPHSVSIFCVTLGLLLVLDCLDKAVGFAPKALAGGAALGFGLMFRTDTILALPAIGLVVWLFAKRPFGVLPFLGLGLLPFIALTSAFNYMKFGTINPLSYGQTAPGGTSLSSHLQAIGLLMLVSLPLIASRFVEWRPGKREYAMGLIVVTLVLVLSPSASDFAQRYLQGAWALTVDATAIHDTRPGVLEGPGGVISFWGQWKKAVGQSMPWLGLLFLAFHLPNDGVSRRAQWIVLILVSVWSLPFFMMSWHGGMGSNMRYFLPVIPTLCALSARLLIDFASPMANAPRILAIGALTGVFATTLWRIYHPTHLAGTQQILSTGILAVVAGFGVLSGLRWAGQRVVRIICLCVIGSGLAVSTVFSVADFRKAQNIRSAAELIDAATTNLPERTLVYAPTRFIARWAFRPGHIAALPNARDGGFDFELIDQALDKGYRVLVWPNYINDGLRNRYGKRLGPSGIAFPGGKILEVTRPDTDH